MSRLFFLLLFSCFIASCTDLLETQPERNVVGFSQCTSNDLWRISMNQEIERVGSIYPQLEFEIRDGQASNEKQIRDIEYFIEIGVDILIVSPNESEPIRPIIERAHALGIKVILLDRRINSNHYTAYIGGDNFEIGKLAGSYAKLLLNGKGKILEIHGLKGSSPAQERHNGFTEQLLGSSISVTDGGDGGWVASQTKELVRELYKKGEQFDLIFAHNDVMAVSAYEVSKEYGLHEGTFFLGVDALAGEFGGVKKVQEGILTATFLYATGGKEAIQMALDIANGREVEKEKILQTALVNIENADIFQLQDSRITEQYDFISQQQMAIDNQLIRYDNQRYWLLLISFFFVLAVMAVIFMFVSFFYIKRINLSLIDKNRSIIRQRDELRELSLRIEQYNKEKIDFFTFISHEFKTPISLIKSMIYRIKNSQEGVSKRQLSVIEHNASRLNQLVEQVMDFRRFEENKVIIESELCNIKDFLTTLIEGFRYAVKREFQMEVKYDKSPLVMIDTDKFEKIVENLISNAVKYSDDGGLIQIAAQINENQLCLTITDNGIGIAENKIEKLFDPFFVVTDFKDSRFGTSTGIGLNLVKQIVDLYNGSLEVVSKPEVGTTFICKLPVKVVLVSDKPSINNIPAREQKDIYCAKQVLELPIQHMGDTKIMIIEDDIDLNEELNLLFQTNGFRVKTAFNGADALGMLDKFKPNLILTDFMMPELDGMEFTRKLKADVAYWNIPVLMLTGVMSIEIRRKGYTAGVEDYMNKPFDPELLIQKVKNIILSRQKLAESVSREYQSRLNMNINDIEPQYQDFIKRLANILQIRYTDPEFNVTVLAKELNTSRVTLYNNVKSLMSIGPVELIRSWRLSVAKSLITNTEMTVSEIAYKVGFQNTSYFAKMFRKEFNISPSDMIQNERQNRFS